MLKTGGQLKIALYTSIHPEEQEQLQQKQEQKQEW
jgi:hypothetical protein